MPEKQITKPLPELAKAINAEHYAAEADAKDAVNHALAAGKMLNEAKTQLTHGEWLDWLEKNFEGTRRTATRYMKVAANGTRVSHLKESASINEALRVIAGPKSAASKSKPKSAPRKPEPTEDQRPITGIPKGVNTPEKLRLSFEVTQEDLKAITKAHTQYVRAVQIVGFEAFVLQMIKKGIKHEGSEKTDHPDNITKKRKHSRAKTGGEEAA